LSRKQRREFLKFLGAAGVAALPSVLLGREWGIQEAYAAATLQKAYLNKYAGVMRASYIIFIDPNDTVNPYKAKNNDGAIEFQGPDAASVIQQAINALPNGGLIYIKRGSYIISTSIILSPYIHVVGEGKDLTILKLANGVNAPIFKTLTNQLYWMSPVIRDMTLDGNKANNTAGNIIEIWNSMHGELTGLNINSAAQSGIWVQGTSSSLYGLGLRIVNVNIEACGRDAIEVGTGGWFFDLFITNSNFGNCGRNGLTLPEGSVVSNCHIWSNGGNGIEIFQQKRGLITNCVIEKNTGQGIHLYAAEHWKISNCHIYNNAHGIMLEAGCYHNVIVGNEFFNNRAYGIYEDASNLQTIVGNRFAGNTSGTYRRGGDLTLVKDNQGHDTQNFRYSSNIPIGVNGAYGSVLEANPYNAVVSGRVGLPRVKITWGGTFGAGETVTVKVAAVYTDGTSAFVEKSATAPGSLWLTDDDIFSLIALLKDIYKLQFSAKTNLASTSATVLVQAYGN
jgi:parallel beta-helix repeat protein